MLAEYLEEEEEEEEEEFEESEEADTSGLSAEQARPHGAACSCISVLRQARGPPIRPVTE